MSKITYGSVVRLKSGGPKMTVESYPCGRVTCVWFDDQKKLHREEYFLDVLKKVWW